MHVIINCFILLSLPLLISGCSGADSSAANPSDTSNSDLYVGYYFEDKIANPEDPTAGTLFLNIPKDNGSFSGSMSFSYYGCQTSNIGTISGSKDSSRLVGSWSGSVDGSAQAGDYMGDFEASTSTYRGTYDVSAGKQFKSIPGCIDYYIAPNGTWTLFPQNTTKTFDSSVATPGSVNSNVISWHPPSGYQYSLLSIIDQSSAQSGVATAIISQSILVSTTTATLSPALITGKIYIASIASFSSAGQILYVTNITFVK